jgi:hypothetical protein
VTEMATLLDHGARPGCYLPRQECLASSSSSSSCSPARLAGTGRGVAASLTTLASRGAQKQSRGSRRPRAASGSVQQQEEEVAAVGTITIGQFVVQGLRGEMEDEVVVEADGPNGFSYAAIFDGHAGVYSATFLR